MQIIVLPGEKIGFLIWYDLISRQLWLYAMFASGWGIVCLINDSTKNMVHLGILTYT